MLLNVQLYYFFYCLIWFPPTMLQKMAGWHIVLLSLSAPLCNIATKTDNLLNFLINGIWQSIILLISDSYDFQVTWDVVRWKCPSESSYMRCLKKMWLVSRGRNGYRQVRVMCTQNRSQSKTDIFINMYLTEWLTLERTFNVFTGHTFCR